MKAIKIAIFALAGLIFASALALFFIYTLPANPVLRNSQGGESIGWALAGVLLIMMFIFVIRTLFHSPRTSSSTKNKILPVYQLINQFHMPIGTVAVALMYLHFAFVFNVNDPSSIHFVTGYFMAGLMASVVALGFLAFFNKSPKRKLFTSIHQILVLALFILFFVHIFVR